MSLLPFRRHGRGDDAPDDDAGPIMTPMIDIVFQLLVFFLLTLRFKTVDERIDTSQPRQRGVLADNAFADPEPRLVVKLFRKGLDGPPEGRFTRLRVGGAATIDLPAGTWGLGEAADARRRAAYETTLARLRATLEDVARRLGPEAGRRGEIATPRPSGQAVPHGDVVAVLDAFLAVGISDVTFEGARSPLPVSGEAGAR